MAYWQDRWEFLNSIEFEYKFAGKYGARGEKRAKKIKATPEQIKKQNQQNKENRMRRIIKKNFISEDYWVTFKYPKGMRKRIDEITKDSDKCISCLRYAFQKRGEQLKWVRRIEIGDEGGIHIHMLINRARGKPDTDLLIKEKWKHGIVNFQTIYEYGGYQKLANYIVKKAEGEAYEQLMLFDMQEQKKLLKYSTSRNLIRPEPERKVYEKRTVEKLIKDGPVASEGFYIDKNTIVYGVNKYTGFSYLRYTECRINEIVSRREGGT